MPEWEIFVKEVRREMTAKAGQKCTAIRRIFVPSNRIEDMWIAISRSLQQTTIGNPANENVKMGSLAGKSQREEVRKEVQRLLAGSQLIYGSMDSVELVDADPDKGAFLSPLLILNTEPFQNDVVHSVEAFGPVSTIMPYDTNQDATLLAKKARDHW
jgi:oxepin-CoA hydrolase/3-oxo-5,6-dehydrosuberyl-CoA semialdehyde dehydrogenase